MAARQTTSRNLKSLAGAGFLVLGLVLLFVNLDGVAGQISDAVGAPAESFSILPALGLAGLHAVQAYTFDHTEFLSSVMQILVSFWPLILILVGAALLKRAFGMRSVAFEAPAGSPGTGDK